MTDQGGERPRIRVALPATDPATGATIGALTVEGTAVRFRTSLAPAAAAVALAGWRPIPSG